MPRDVLINGPSDPLDGLWTAGKLRRVAVAPHTYNAGMLLENMTWPEAERIDFSMTPLVIPLGELKSELSAHQDVLVAFASYWWLGAQALTAVRKSGIGGVGHACEMETSAMLVIAPGKVDMSLARKSGPGAGCGIAWSICR